MHRPTRNFGNHRVAWSPETNSLVITPQYPNTTATDKFGLGDALISLNLSDLPPDIVVPITRETTGQGILPTSPFKLKRWYGLPSNMNNVTKTLTGFDGWTENITYPEASSGSVKEVTPVSIIQNGYGCEEIVDPSRMQW